MRSLADLYLYDVIGSYTVTMYNIDQYGTRYETVTPKALNALVLAPSEIVAQAVVDDFYKVHKVKIDSITARVERVDFVGEVGWR